ncbi:amino acid/amide ABC transporter ATP-binding protein 2, HAAT family [Bartonella sp. CDC_skunk]|uniref:ABC transporter ATP-binding protein n=1 Tax=unclassified Bartonella TaxID=2645622 RepID=UPI00099A1937|nr:MULTISPECIES: ABC transporter ATP-binding protein [unclassified Bartonella]AQX21321.1 amino acid/amide ABC transporter ATP-binding protein 2, HAAT family [Bartonella sp. CDC_skunk]AQX26579.1 amino acid/amide ABC transporter ATP-binding protein 2, HAAT family [Bartonella sp. Raccoon60]
MNILEIKNLHVHYGAIKAVQDLSMSIKKGSIVTLIGANGAGKSSTVHSIVGLNRSIHGEIIYKGKSIIKKQPEEILRLGIALTPEGRRIIPHFTVLENLQLGAYICNDKTVVTRNIEWIFDLFPRLRERSQQLSGTMSGGEQQMLTVGRTLMSNPDIVILDEPSLGLAPLLVREIFSIIKKINDMGKTVLLIEQNASAALSIANYAYILEVGKILFHDEAKALLSDPRVKDAYLGN